MAKRPPKPNKGKGAANFLNLGGKRSSQKSTIHIFLVSDKDEITMSAQKGLRSGGSKPSTPLTSTGPGPQRDFQTHNITVPDVYNFEQVAKMLPAQINGSTYNTDNTAIMYLVNINRDPPPSIHSTFPKAMGKKCHPSRFFWITVGWDEEHAIKQKTTEFELRNDIMRPIIQQGSHFMRLPRAHGAFTREVALLVEQGLDAQEGNQRGWKNKFIDNALDTLLWHSVESKAVEIDDLTANDIIIAVMGPTGAGKSTFIKTISGHDVVIGHSLESCTSEVSIIRFRAPELTESNIALVDTPGFDDTNKSDLEIFKMIAEWLDKTFKRKILLDGVLYLHRISDNRMAGTPYKNYQMFERLCGKSSFKQVILVTTMWGEESEKELHEKRETELRQRFWSPMIKNGSTIARFDESDNKSAFNVIAPIVSNASVTRQALTLQTELNDIRLALPETSAGRVMYTKLEALLERQKKILDDLRKDIAAEEQEMTGYGGEARGAGTDMAKILKEEYQSIEVEMKTVVADLQAMRLSVPSRLLTSLKSRFQLRFSFSKVT